MTPEQKARDMLDSMGVDGAQSMTAGDLVELANLLAERDALQKDAERYRWLRDNATVATPHIATPDGWKHYRSGADEVVDAAMAKEPKP